MLTLISIGQFLLKAWQFISGLSPSKQPAPVLEGEKAGAAAAGEAADQAAAKASAAEAQAAVDAPKTQADVVSALDRGTF